MRLNSSVSQKPLGLIAVFSLALSIAAVLCALMAGSARADISDLGKGAYLVTTNSLCAIEVSPQTATLNVGQTQTFSFVIRQAPDMNESFWWFQFYEDVAQSPGEDSGLIYPTDVFDACVNQNFERLAGANVVMEVVSGPSAGLVLEAQLQADGTVTFPLVNGGIAGTSEVRFSIDLPQACLYIQDYGEAGNIDFLSTDACDEGLTSQVPDSRSAQRTQAATPRLAPGARIPAPSGLPVVTLQSNAAITWVALPPVVPLPGSVVAVKSIKNCVSSRIRVRPNYSANLRSARLVIDGRTVKRKNTSSGFVINTKKYKSGRHRFKVVATYDSGSITSNTGSFTKCRVKASVRRVKPKFTG